MDIEKLIVLAKQVAKPWAIVCYVLAVLLGLSIGGNIYQAMQGQEIIIDNNADFDYSDNNENSVHQR